MSNHRNFLTESACEVCSLLHVSRVKGKVWVTPTRLALALSGGTSGEVQQGVAEGYVIVETNYRVCMSARSLLFVGL